MQPLNNPEYIKTCKPPFVFLGGTCNGSLWREALLEGLLVSTFNPVVENWDEAAKAREDEAKYNAETMLYVITPKQKGFYSIAELTHDSLSKRNTIVAFIDDPDGTTWDEHQVKSNTAIAELVGANKLGGPKVFYRLDELRDYMNNELPWSYRISA